MNFLKDKPEIYFANRIVNDDNYANYDEEIEDSYYSVEIYGKKFNEMDFHVYPHGTIDLVVELEIEDNTIDKSVFVIIEKIDEPNFEGRYIPGWNLIDWNAETKADDNEINFRFIVTYYLEKSIILNFLISFLPIFVIVLFYFYQDPYEREGYKASI